MIRLRKITRSFRSGDRVTKVLRGIDLEVEDGEFVAIMGRSGAGKSTLMYQMSLLDRPTGGQVYLNGDLASDFNTSERARYRLYNMGFIFQDYALIPELTAVENVMSPLLMQGLSGGRARRVARCRLEDFGLGKRLDNLPSQLSGGEQQRVSIARAVANNPKILFADEPTANLDSENAQVVLESLDQLHKAGQTIIMVTHEREYAGMAERIITMEDGRILKDRIMRHSRHRGTRKGKTCLEKA